MFQLYGPAASFNPAVIVAQEQYKVDNQIRGIPQSWTTFSSTSQKAALILPPFSVKPALVSTKTNTVAIKIQTNSHPITIVSTYSSPNQDLVLTL
ncbi:hypothetical protein AVEN_214475-1 [Araneus ventricosus]|uniref:Uncharacterized protein n=1 Tax=Araneus ventricosus TaxID=182803 RepID=A0A4Y2CXX1_ARAVE|nr:hypothetical protein AVEN_214475-1 [Araneus ventricosus]